MKYIQRYIIIKLKNTQNKKQIIKVARKKRQIHFKGAKVKVQVSSQNKPEYSGMIFSILEISTYMVFIMYLKMF